MEESSNFIPYHRRDMGSVSFIYKRNIQEEDFRNKKGTEIKDGEREKMCLLHLMSF